MSFFRPEGRRFGQAAIYGAGASYVGPGDLAAITWSSFGSVQNAFTAAYAASGASAKAFDIVDSAGANPATILYLANGYLDTTTLNTWTGTHGTAYINKLYDHTVNANHWTQTGTPATDFPTYIASGINSKPTLAFSGNSQRLVTTGNISLTGPWTTHFITEKSTVGSGGTAIEAWSHNVGSNALFYPAGLSNTMTIQVSANITVTDAVAHKIQALFVAGASDLNVDGTSHVTTQGVNNASNTQRLFWNGSGPINWLGEIGTNNLSSFSSALSSNVLTRWGI